MTLPVREHFTIKGQAKKAYDSYEEASIAAQRQQEINGSKRRPYHGYECICGKWHVGRRKAR